MHGCISIQGFGDVSPRRMCTLGAEVSNTEDAAGMKGNGVGVFAEACGNYIGEEDFANADLNIMEHGPIYTMRNYANWVPMESYDRRLHIGASLEVNWGLLQFMAK